APGRRSAGSGMLRRRRGQILVLGGERRCNGLAGGVSDLAINLDTGGGLEQPDILQRLIAEAAIDAMLEDEAEGLKVSLNGAHRFSLHAMDQHRDAGRRQFLWREWLAGLGIDV